MKKPLSFWIFLFSGIFTLVCIPLILISEKLGYPQYPYNVTQMIMIPICFASGIRCYSKYKGKLGGFLKFLIAIGVSLCCLFILFVGFLLFDPIITDYWKRERFDAEVWRDEGYCDRDTMWPHRLCMVDILMSSGKLDGLSREQVAELLGPPEDKGFPFGAVDSDIHYYLGPERGSMRIDSEWLFITFGEDDKVNRYWLYRD